jgi:hypothetical protein
MMPFGKRDMPAWVEVSLVAAMLLAVSWLAMFLESATRR